MKTAHRKTILTDTVETLADAGRDIAKETAKTAASVVDINAFLYGAPPKEELTEAKSTKQQRIIKEYGTKMHEKGEKPGDVNHTPLDVRAIREKQQIQDIKTRLFNLQQSETQKAKREQDQKEQKRVQDSEQETQNKKAKEAQSHEHAPEESHGKAKAHLGQARKKASTETSYETKSNKGK